MKRNWSGYAALNLVVTALIVSACAGDDVTDGAPQPLIGSHYGLKVAETLPQDDRDMLDALTQQSLDALPDGASREWSNPAAGTSGTLTIMSTTQTSAKGRCRLFAQQIYQDGRLEKALGEACLNQDENWILQSWTPG